MWLRVDDISMSDFIGVSSSKSIDIYGLTERCDFDVHQLFELAF